MHVYDTSGGAISFSPPRMRLLATRPLAFGPMLATIGAISRRAQCTMAVTMPPITDSSGAPLQETFAGKRVAYYFTAGWCPMCTRFEPSLLQFKAAAEQAGKPIELIMVSSDRSSADAQKRAKALGLPLVEYDGDSRSDLKRRFSVWAGAESAQHIGYSRRSGVPALVVINEAGDEIGFLDAESSGPAALSKWELDDGVWGDTKK
jgi:nucleoredoxin